MARGLRLWGAIALAACGIVAVVYLPPRGGISPRESGFGPRVPQPTAARLREQGLAEQWRAARAAVQLADYRGGSASLRDPSSPGLNDSASITAVVIGVDRVPVPPAATAVVRSALDSAWQRLGLGATKVRVRVIIELLPQGSRFVGTPAFGRETPPVYLFPDSTDRTSCTVLIPAGAYWTRILLGQQWPYGQAANVPRLDQWLQGSLGPCAFYATYGTPGKPVRRWLARRGYDLALHPATDKDSPGTGSIWFLGATRYTWYWDWIYRYPSETVACMAGRAEGCGRAVLAGTQGGFDDTVPRLLAIRSRWWQVQELLPGERYLADVAREVGRDRFLRFWNSPLPVDTTLAEALKMPVGEWTQRWERRFVPRLRLGAAAPASASVLGFLLAFVAVASVALTARHRQVR